MSRRAIAGAAVAAFAVLVGTVIVMAGRGGGTRLTKLPIGAAAGADSTGAVTPGAMLAPIRPIEYRVAGTLPPLGGTATAYRLSGSVTPSQVARLAQALGLTAPVQHDADGFTAHTDAWQLRVTNDAAAPWSYGPYAPCPDAPVTAVPPDSPSGAGTKPPGAIAPSGCAVASPGVISSPTPIAGGGSSAGGGSAEGGSTTDGATKGGVPSAVPPTRPADLPPKDEARRLALATLGRAGIDTEAASVRVDDGFYQWLVAVEPKVDGRPVAGMTTGVSVGRRGQIQYAYGFLAQPTAIGDYPVVGTTKGVERLNTGFGIGPRPMMGAATDATSGSGTGFKAPPPTVTDTPTAAAGSSGSGGSSTSPSGGAVPPSPPVGTVPTNPPPVSEPVTTLPPMFRTITGARLGLTFVADYLSAGRGTAYLVPSYVFTTDDGTAVTVIAVTEDFLATTTGTDVRPDGKR